ncbi:hypothetical protein HYW54_04415 [Candidatus Gottesmanbacteria bacterium]|nr:hypothetical protein [Candidatus Gottesmanbacteria bacterium]
MNKTNGQILVTLLFFVVIAIIITSGAVVVILTNSLSASKFAQGNVAYYIAESGIENALLRLLRNPSYNGETLAIEDATALITVSGDNPKTITSVGSIGNFSRTIEVIADYTDNILTVTSWKEIY